MTPAEELKAAAAKLRALADDTEPGPWKVDKGATPSEWCGVIPENGMFGPNIKTLWLNEARWIATLSPAIAEPLASWLEYEGNRLLSFPDGYKVRYTDDYPPFVLARVINEGARSDRA